MSERIIITEKTLNHTDYWISARYDDKRMCAVHLQRKDQENLLGSIRVGRVANIVPNLQGAFIEIEKGLSCFYSLKESRNPVFTKKQGKKPLCVGDELLVEVTAEGIKTKPPAVSTNLNFHGNYLVLTSEKRELGISKKLNAADRARLRELLEPYCQKDYGLIVRTCAKDAEEKLILEDLEKLEGEYRQFLEHARHRTLYSVLRSAEPSYLKFLKEQDLSMTDRITTDLPQIYRELSEYFEDSPTESTKLHLHEDPMISLSALYSLEHELDRALLKRVWLPSGGYLVIEPTEALTVIDVNSGKINKKSSQDEMILTTNREAAIEIARQLILRNISGICVIDFIDMKKEYQTQLLQILRAELKKDKIPTSLVDMTALGLVELTRKKVQKSLKEQLQGAKPYEK